MIQNAPGEGTGRNRIEVHSFTTYQEHIAKSDVPDRFDTDNACNTIFASKTTITALESKKGFQENRFLHGKSVKNRKRRE